MIAKINDPLRAEAYADLGIATLCRTNLMATRSATSSACRESGRACPATGQHPGGEHPPRRAGHDAGGRRRSRRPAAPATRPAGSAGPADVRPGAGRAASAREG